MGKADLHIHTTASDGRATPDEIVQLALQQNLKMIAVTDHDTIAGNLRAQKAAEGTDLEVIPGVEITTDYDGREVHLLAYFFDPGHQEIQKMLRGHKFARKKRAQWILQQLAQEGLDVTMNEVKAEANGSNLGRPHIAAVLVDKGYVASFKEAFIRYLSNEALGAIPNQYVSLSNVISVVKKAGGAAVLAHPGMMYSTEEMVQFVQEGIDGIEVLHPSHHYDLQKKVDEFAEQNQLIKTGGSDFHGSGEAYKKYFGVITINSNVVERMRKMTDQRKRLSV